MKRIHPIHTKAPSAYPYEMEDARINVASLFVHTARSYPDRTALIQGSKAIRYGELFRQVQEAAAYFAKRDIGPGDRVLLLLPPGVALYRTALALLYVGAAVVIIDHRGARKHFSHCVERAQCRAMVVSPKYLPLRWLYPSLRRIPMLLRTHGRIRNTNFSMRTVPPDTPAILTFTTGSAGRPKASSRSHDFLFRQFEVLHQLTQARPTDVVMTNLPMIAFFHLAVGATCVLPPTSLQRTAPKITPWIPLLHRHRVCRLIAAPSYVTALCRYLRKNNIHLPHLREVYTGGGPVFPSMAQTFLQDLPQASITVVYGSTEVEPISTITVQQLLTQVETNEIGLPAGEVHPDLQVAVIPTDAPLRTHYTIDEWRTLQCSDGQIGEIVVAGPHVLTTYFNSPEAFHRNKIVVDGTIWHRTGDSGYLKGRQLFLTGRVRQIIRYKGHTLYPFYIERLLDAHPAVERGTLLHIDQHLILAVQYRPGWEYDAFNTAQIPHDLLLPVRKMPMDPRHHSKIDYDALQEMTHQLLKSSANPLLK